MITIHNLRTEKPVHPYDVRIDRGHSVLANLYHMHGESQRNKVCDDYDVWFNEAIEVETPGVIRELASLQGILVFHDKLRLFCWCAPLRCHGETIRDYLLKVIALQK